MGIAFDNELTVTCEVGVSVAGLDFEPGSVNAASIAFEVLTLSVSD